MFISFAVHSPPSALVSFFFLFLFQFFSLYLSRMSFLCRRTTIRVMSDKVALRYQNVCLVSARLFRVPRKSPLNKKITKKIPSSVANLLPNQNGSD